jgi:hypothetical protein
LTTTQQNNKKASFYEAFLYFKIFEKYLDFWE